MNPIVFRTATRADLAAIVALLADDPLARIDVPHFAASAGATVLEVVDAPNGAISFLVAKAP